MELLLGGCKRALNIDKTSTFIVCGKEGHHFRSYSSKHVRKFKYTTYEERSTHSFESSALFRTFALIFSFTSNILRLISSSISDIWHFILSFHSEIQYSIFERDQMSFLGLQFYSEIRDSTSGWRWLWWL